MNIFKTALLSATFCFAGTVSAAHAGDIYGRGELKDGPGYMPPIVWTGFYVGLNAGATLSDDEEWSWDGYSVTWENDAAYLLGAQWGMNYQTSNFVLGLEADLTASGADGVAFIGTLRCRVGLPMDKSLIYVTGGLASLQWEGEDADATGGWVLGAGYEQKVTSTLGFGIEGLYYSFSDEAYDIEYDRDMWAVRGRVNWYINIR